MQVQDSKHYKPLEQFVKTHKKNQEKCPICFESFKLSIIPQNNIQDLAITKCSHVFHKACLETWTSTQDSCPNCRERNIKATIDDSSYEGHLIFNELLKPQNERKRKAEEIDDARHSHEASTLEIAQYLIDNYLLKSDLVNLKEIEAIELIDSSPKLSYTVRWIEMYESHFVTYRDSATQLVNGIIFDKEKLDRILPNNILVIPKKYIEAYNTHRAKKRRILDHVENNLTTNKATDFKTIKFHLEIRREFALTMSEQEVSEIIDNFPAGTKIFFINETNQEPIVAEKTNTELGPVIKHSFLTEVLQNTTLEEYIENNNIMVPKKYRDDYQRAAFDLQEQKPNANLKEQSKSNSEKAKELQETGQTLEQLAQLKADE